jgi:hypothetical protein
MLIILMTLGGHESVGAAGNFIDRYLRHQEFDMRYAGLNLTVLPNNHPPDHLGLSSHINFCVSFLLPV